MNIHNYVDWWDYACTRSTSDLIECPYCNSDFSRDFYLEEDDFEEIQCVHCGKTFAVCMRTTHKYFGIPNKNIVNESK